MRTFLFLFLFISISCFSQNSDTYFSIRISEGMYEYLDSCGITKMEGPDSCDCRFDIYTKFWEITKKVDAHDSLLLNEFADEWVIDNLLSSLKKEFHKIKFDSKEKISQVNFNVDIKRLSNRFHLWSFKRKVKYKLIVEVYYKPILP